MPTVDPTLPEPVRRFLAAGARLERIRLDAEGQWSHEGQPFRNERLKELFHRSIERTPGGTWVLHVPPFTYPIEVADTAYHVRSLRFAGDDAVLLRLSDGTDEPLLPRTLAYRPGRGLYCQVKTAAGPGLAARFNRPAYDELCDRLLREESGRYYMMIDGQRVSLGNEDENI